MEQGKSDNAYQVFIASFELSWDLNHWNGIYFTLENDAKYLIFKNDLFHAVNVLGTVEEIHERISYTLPPHERMVYDRMIRDLETKMGKEQFKRAFNQGKQTILEEMVLGLLRKR